MSCEFADPLADPLAGVARRCRMVKPSSTGERLVVNTAEGGDLGDSVELERVDEREPERR